MTNLLIGVGFLVFGIVLILLGVGVAYWLYRRQVSEEKEENSRVFSEGVQDRIREDSPFVFIVITVGIAIFAYEYVSFAAALFFFAGLVLMRVTVKMAPDDADHEEESPEPVPESDPKHIDPAGDLADAVDTGELEISLADDQDVDELREFVERAEAGEFDPVDPGLEAQVRIARSLLDDVDGGEGDT